MDGTSQTLNCQPKKNAVGENNKNTPEPFQGMAAANTRGGMSFFNQSKTRSCGTVMISQHEFDFWQVAGLHNAAPFWGKEATAE